MKKFLKRTLSIILTAIMLMGFLPAGIMNSVTEASALESSGRSADVYWTFNESTGLLTLSGTGELNFIRSFEDKPEIKDVVINEGVTQCPQFTNCKNLRTLTLSSTVMTGLSGFGLSNCPKLEKITISSKNPYFCTDSYGVVYSKDKTVLISCPGVFNYSSYTIPEGVKEIDSDAFESYGNNRDIKSITFPNSLEKIGDFAFSDSGLNLTTISFGNNLKEIGRSAFSECNIKNIILPESLEIICPGAFNSAKCESLTIVKNISCPENTYLDGTTIVDNFYSFFDLRTLNEFNISGDNSQFCIDNGNLFSKDKTILIKYSNKNSEQSYTVPNTVKKITTFAFCDSNLSSITIPVSVEVIEYLSFSDCDKLKDIYYEGTKEQWNSISLDIDDSPSLQNATIHFADKDKPTGSISSTNNVATSQTVTLSLSDNEGVAGYYWGTSSTYSNNTYTTTSSTNVSKSISSAGTYYLTVKDTSGNVSSNYSITFYKTTLNANGGSVSPTSVLTKSGNSFTFPTPTKSGYTYAGWSISSTATSGVTTLKPTANATYYAVWKSSGNIYNLGEETYSFENYGDSDSAGGHCFGMSSTSSGYYIGALNVSDIGISASSKLYTLSETQKVKAPICSYQKMQGRYSLAATVAGGSYYKTKANNLSSDWFEVINYVKSHEYDDKGILQIGFRCSSEGGHAINFLRYKVVDGQERIYAYDNNFPDTETYFYKDSSGKIVQAPYSTFSGRIDCIALRNMSKYFSVVDDFDSTRYIYAEKDAIKIEDSVTEYPIDGGIEMGEYIMYEIPDGVEQITIVPLEDSAEFEYLDETYSFGTVSDDTIGKFTLVSSDDESQTKPTLVIGKKATVSISDIEMNYKSSAKINTSINTDSNVKYTTEYNSSDSSVATVDKDGNVYGAKKGSATITCTITDEYGNSVSDTCTVNVKYAWWQWIIVILLFGWIWY